MLSPASSPAKGSSAPSSPARMRPDQNKEYYSKNDSSTLSNCTEVVSTHVHLNWKLDFAKQTLSGTCQHTVLLLTAAHSISFDSSALTISDVVFENHEPAEFIMATPHPVLGTMVTVILPEKYRRKGKKLNITFTYSASPQASAIQWLEPAATHGKRHPYVYTQCQAIHARSLLPCMDTPGVKSTYSAEVNVPEWCTVLMSALSEKQPTDPPGCYRFAQLVPTPAYLIALAAGDLESREISPRVRIWAEPGVVAAAASDFSQTEDFLQAAESLTCPYAWTRYDVLCLPPSFPYGGMENPCLTFATPTLLTGDKSLADVIAHEIAHSWTGNLVTNHTWSHFFLNEGWTMWLQRKIEQRVKGGVEHLKLSAQSGWNHLKDDINHMGADNKFTRLVWPLEEGADPDDAFSGIPYEKGFNLLYMLEGIVGTVAFEEFAKAYISTFKFGTVTSGEFKDYFLEFFNTPDVDPATQRVLQGLDWDQLLLGNGMPLHTPDFSNSLSEASLSLASRWIDAAKRGANGVSGAGESDISSWSTQQRILFLEALLNHVGQHGMLSMAYIQGLDRAYKFTACANAEIKFRWQSICIKCEASFIVPHIVNFVTSQGRMKYVRPLYRLLRASKVGSEAALETFLKHQFMYHPICRKMIQTDFNGADGEIAAGSSADGVSERNSWIWPSVLIVGVAVTIGIVLSRRR